MKGRLLTISIILIWVTLPSIYNTALLSGLFSSGLELAEPQEDTFSIETRQEIKDKEEQDAKKEEEEPEDLSLYKAPIAVLPDKLSTDYLKVNIVDFHNSVKTCLDDHFKRDVQDQIQLKLIIQDCAGKKGDTLTRYYNDIKFLTKKYLYDTIKDKLGKGYCDEDFHSCIQFMRALQLFVELSYDIANSIDANFDILETSIGLDKTQYLKTLCSDAIAEYNDLRSELRRQQEFLLHYFRIKREQFGQEYAEFQENKESKDDESNDDDDKTQELPVKTRNKTNDSHKEDNKHDTHDEPDDQEMNDHEELTPEEIRNRHNIAKIYREHQFHYSEEPKNESAFAKANQAGEDSIKNFVPEPDD